MSNKDIIKIFQIKNIRIKNLHNGVIFPPQTIEVIVFRDNSVRVLDLVANRDITDIDYFSIIHTPEDRYITLFEEGV